MVGWREPKGDAGRATGQTGLRRRPRRPCRRSVWRRGRAQLRPGERRGRAAILFNSYRRLQRQLEAAPLGAGGERLIPGRPPHLARAALILAPFPLVSFMPCTRLRSPRLL
jgi:hypothetical protein